MPARRPHSGSSRWPVYLSDPRAARDVVEGLESRRLLSAVSPAQPDLGADATPLPVLNHLVLPNGPLKLPPKRTPGTVLAMSNQSAASSPPAAPASLASDPLLESAFGASGGALTGKFVFTSGGHGWQWNTNLGRYATDRGDNNEIVEDFGNQEQMTAYADYLLRAGATVIPMRPVGRQINEVVLDNDSAGVTYTGSWSNSVGTQYYDEDYGASADSVSYRFASTTTGTESAVATYTPNIPAAGFYPIYSWVARGTNRTTQLYRINYSGGSTEIRVDHRKVGFGWVYLGTYNFNNGSSAANGSVQISNNSSVSGVVIADAIRFGNGMGDYVWTGSGASAVSGYPREDENSYHWIARSVGVGTSLSTAIGSGTTNVSAPSNFAQYMFAGSFGEAVYIGIHSNAGGGRAARGLIDADTVDRTPHQTDLALYLGRQINQDMQALDGTFEYDWDNGTTHTFNGEFGELDLGGSAEMDATIIEVAFHDSVEDAAIMRDPKGRDQIARSILQGTIEYFQNWGGLTNTTSLPTKPTNIRAVSNASGQVTVNWAAGPSTPAAVYGAAATGYRVYTSTNGYGFDLAATISGGGTTSTTLTGLTTGVPLYIRVAATNAGGESSPSEVMTALPSGGSKQILIVNGFDRLDRAQDFRYSYAFVGDGLVDRVWPRYNNSFDYVVNVHNAISAAKPGARVASTSNEAVISGAVNLNDYQSVIWILGNESTTNDTFDATEQTKVEQYIAAGGNLFVSGAEVGWDLDQQNNGRSFYETTLKGNYVSDDAGTYTATAVASGIFAGLSSLVFSSGSPSTGASAFSNLSAQLYNVATPDVIAPQAGAITNLNYSGGTGGAAGIQATGTGGRGNVVLFGFPFETLTDATRRQQVMGRILDFFADSRTPGTPDLLAAYDTGSSSSDNRTRLATSLQLTIPSVIQDAAVRLYDNGNLFLETTAPSTGPLTLTTPANYTFTDGTHNITVTQTEAGLLVSESSATLSLTIDTVAPTVTLTPVSPNPRSTPLPSQAVNFSESVTGLAASAFTLTAYAPATNLLTAAQTLGGAGSAYTLTNLSTVTSNAGAYTLTLTTAAVTDLAGNPLAAGATASWVNDTIATSSPTTVSRNASDPNALDVTTGPSTYTFSLTPLLALTLASPAITVTTDLANFPLTLADNTNVVFATTQHLSIFNLPATFSIDLLDNDLVLDLPTAGDVAAAMTAFRQHLAAGRLFSSTAIANPLHTTALGYTASADVGLTSYAGQPVSATALLVKYTYLGDTDLDGRVTADDLARIDRGRAKGLDTWLWGDSNYDAIVDSSDIALAHTAFRDQGTVL